MPDNLRVIIIAGPNGAGKTTFAREFLPKEADCPVFLNADLIAAGLAPFSPETVAIRAGRLMLQEMQRHFIAHQSFAFETTLSGRTYLRLIEQWRAAGYRVKLIFLQLDSPEEAIARVAHRVQQGGHERSRESSFVAASTRDRQLRAPYPAGGLWALYDKHRGAAIVLLDWSDDHERLNR